MPLPCLQHMAVMVDQPGIQTAVEAAWERKAPARVRRAPWRPANDLVRGR
ncbi:MAG: hypothetical protein JO179_23165 [Solirubrobacterales bacterium]|nr:hypothetical protein [Solirubrobacterales bacterium]